MKKTLGLLVAVLMISAFGIVGCAQKAKTASSSEAIEQAKQMQSVEDQVKFLVSEANAFLNSQKFDEAVNTAKYVLGQLDANSQDAKSIIEKAQAELKKLAEQKMQDVKGALGNIGQ
jgi:hypothetical protein